jgi:hypothetical protein
MFIYKAYKSYLKEEKWDLLHEDTKGEDTKKRKHTIVIWHLHKR